MNKDSTIQEILKNKTISTIDKRIAIEKWKFNQLPEDYRESHIGVIEKKIRAIRNGTYNSKNENREPCGVCGNTEFTIRDNKIKSCKVCDSLGQIHT